jgi:hypothetical protein
MPRYNYTSPFQCLLRENISYSFESPSLDLAIENARAQHPNVIVAVRADCRIWNLRTSTVVSLYAWQMEGKTHDQIYEMFDLEVDCVVADRHLTEDANAGARSRGKGRPEVC